MPGPMCFQLAFRGCGGWMASFSVVFPVVSAMQVKKAQRRPQDKRA
jgi:hypothetical protein